MFAIRLDTVTDDGHSLLLLLLLLVVLTEHPVSGSHGMIASYGTCFSGKA